MNNLILLGVVLFIAFVLIELKKRSGSDAELKYDAVYPFMNKSEKEFFDILYATVQSQYYVFAKVRLLDIFNVQRGLSRGHRQTLKNYIQSKHVDFLLCDKVTMQPIIAIELDGKSHLNQKRKERDDLVDKIFESANMRIVHVPVASQYNIVEILQPPVPQENVA